ncbi:hypothetical protein GCM10010279_69220 [Streptomyces mutabilis]|nr:hypothetical protein GCM10010279_69220 [Streptomyces mutabilis]
MRNPFRLRFLRYNFPYVIKAARERAARPGPRPDRSPCLRPAPARPPTGPRSSIEAASVGGLRGATAADCGGSVVLWARASGEGRGAGSAIRPSERLSASRTAVPPPSRG